MSDTVDRKVRRPYEPPRLVLPSEEDSAPEGKTTFAPGETIFDGPS